MGTRFTSVMPKSAAARYSFNFSNGTNRLEIIPGSRLASFAQFSTTSSDSLVISSTLKFPFQNRDALLKKSNNSNSILRIVQFNHPESFYGSPDFEAVYLMCPDNFSDGPFAVKDLITGKVWSDLNFDGFADNPPKIESVFYYEDDLPGCGYSA